MPNFTRMLSSKFLMKNFKIWNIQIQGLFKDFQGPWIFFPKFKDFQGLLKDPMNPELNAMYDLCYVKMIVFRLYVRWKITLNISK